MWHRFDSILISSIVTPLSYIYPNRPLESITSSYNLSKPSKFSIWNKHLALMGFEPSFDTAYQKQFH